jgi:septal ring factor EnvC (AmiA/AmiB activator)
MQMQTKAIDTMQTQQQNMAQLQRTIAKLSSAHETVASGVVTVQREIEKRDKGVGREVDRMSRLLMSRTQNEQGELQSEIHSLTIANDRLSKERLDLERSNHELKQQLKAAGMDVSKATPSKAGSGDLARERENPANTQLADGRRGQESQPLLFWVTFQEGTSEDSIERLVREVQGRRGSFNDGWQALEIAHPAESRDRFLDKIRQAKIVKAVRTVDAR